MNELKQKDKISYEPELHRDAYRRGARRQTKGNLTLAIVVIILAAVVLVGILFVYKVFFGTDDLLKKNVDKPIENVGTVSENVSSQNRDSVDLGGFEDAIKGKKVFNENFLVQKSAGSGFVFENGILNYKIKDMDADGEDEMFTVKILDDGSIEMSVYEKEDNVCRRNGYYLFFENIFENESDFQSDIYLTNSGEKNYIFKESFSKDMWEVTVLEYDENGIKFTENIAVKDSNYTDEISKKLEKYSLKYSGKDYSDSQNSILNAKTQDFVCGFDKKDNTVNVTVR